MLVPHFAGKLGRSKLRALQLHPTRPGVINAMLLEAQGLVRVRAPPHSVTSFH